jgi:hypothetical protein
MRALSSYPSRFLPEPVPLVGALQILLRGNCTCQKETSVSAGARRITDWMMLAAARALAANSPALKDPAASLLPPLTDLRRVTAEIALAVGLQA